jgi:hypothetical protein
MAALDCAHCALGGMSFAPGQPTEARFMIQ